MKSNFYYLRPIRSYREIIKQRGDILNYKLDHFNHAIVSIKKM